MINTKKEEDPLLPQGESGFSFVDKASFKKPFFLVK
jgi:hypothetical protein